MGWDLYARRGGGYFRVSLYSWPRLALALSFLGADTEKMASDNSGKYVPAAVARQWGEAIERGIDKLRMAVVRDSMCKDKEGYFVVPKSYGKKDIAKLLRDYYGAKECRHHGLVRIVQLSRDHRRFLMGFARFCRDSGGFYQW